MHSGSQEVLRYRKRERGGGEGIWKTLNGRAQRVQRVCVQRVCVQRVCVHGGFYTTQLTTDTLVPPVTPQSVFYLLINAHI